MTPNLAHTDWLSIAEQAGTEMNNAKLSVLIEQLCGAIDEEQNQMRRVTTVLSAKTTGVGRA